MTRASVGSAPRPRARPDWLTAGHLRALQTGELNLQCQAEAELVPWRQEGAGSRVHSPRGSQHRVSDAPTHEG